MHRAGVWGRGVRHERWRWGDTGAVWQTLEMKRAWSPKDRLRVAISNQAGLARKAAEGRARHGFNVADAAGAQTYDKEGGVLSKIKPPVDQGEAEAAGRNGTQH